MCVNDSYTKVYSGGKDCKVYATDLRSPDESVLVCEERAPVLSVSIHWHMLEYKASYGCHMVKIYLK